jgi:hypothetical protein
MPLPLSQLEPAASPLMSHMGQQLQSLARTGIDGSVAPLGDELALRPLVEHKDIISALAARQAKRGIAANRLTQKHSLAISVARGMQSRLELGLRLNRGLLQANVLFRLGASLLFSFLFLQSLLGLPLLGLPPRDDEMVVFAVAPPGTRRHIPRLDKLPISQVRRLESEVIADCGRNIQPSPIVQIWLWPFI